MWILKAATPVSILEKSLEKYSQKTSLAEEITMEWEVSVCSDILSTCYYIHKKWSGAGGKQRNDCFITG